MNGAGSTGSPAINLEDIFSSGPPVTQQQQHIAQASMPDDNLLGGFGTRIGSTQPASHTLDNNPFDVFGGLHPAPHQQQQSMPPAAHDDLLGGFEGSLGKLTLFDCQPRFAHVSGYPHFFQTCK